MTASVVDKHFTDASMTLSDGTGTPVTLVVPLSIGDIKISGLSADQKEVKAYYSRGTLVSLRKGQDTHPTITFSAQQADLSSATDPTVHDFVQFFNSFSANISTSTALGDVKTIDILVTIDGVVTGEADHTITCTDVHVEEDWSEGEPNTFGFSGTIYGTVVAV